MVPGEIIPKNGDITLNAGRKMVTVTVANSGDRPVQVGSHYHFFETNPALKFERDRARGMRLNIPSGTAVRFEPGQTREVTLVPYAGKRMVFGFRQDVMGALDRSKSAPAKKSKKKAVSKNTVSKNAAGRPKPARRAHNSTRKV